MAKTTSAKKRLPERECACGCGERFFPKRRHQIYFSSKCRRDDWAAKNSTPIAISKLRHEQRALEARLSAIEAKLGIKGENNAS